MSDLAKVYGLCDDSGLFYVGSTSLSIAKRVSLHKHRDRVQQVVILCEVHSSIRLLAEKAYIVEAQRLGCDLQNQVYTDVHRRMMTELVEKSWQDDEIRVRRTASLKKSWADNYDERIAKLRSYTDSSGNVTRREKLSEHAVTAGIATENLHSAEARAKACESRKLSTKAAKAYAEAGQRLAAYNKCPADRKCNDCGQVLKPGPMGMHLKGAKHSGYTRINTKDES